MVLVLPVLLLTRSATIIHFGTRRAHQIHVELTTRVAPVQCRVDIHDLALNILLLVFGSQHFNQLVPKRQVKVDHGLVSIKLDSLVRTAYRLQRRIILECFSCSLKGSDQVSTC